MIPWVDLGGELMPKINFFSKYGHVVYQIKENESYNNMLVNILPLHTPLAPEMGTNSQICLLFCN